MFRRFRRNDIPLRSREEVKEALEVQRQFILASGKSYDDGKKAEALRLATAVYVIVHDAGRNQSLLNQLGIKGAMRFVCSGRPSDPDNLVRETPLVSARIYSDGTAEYVPRLERIRTRRMMQFHQWWQDDVVLRDGHFRLTRKNLVFTLRNKEGGGHFDAELNDPNYLRFAQEQLTTPYVFSEELGIDKPLLGVELATMRQVAWELLKTLDNYGPIDTSRRGQGCGLAHRCEAPLLNSVRGERNNLTLQTNAVFECLPNYGKAVSLKCH